MNNNESFASQQQLTQKPKERGEEPNNNNNNSTPLVGSGLPSPSGSKRCDTLLHEEEVIEVEGFNINVYNSCVVFVPKRASHATKTESFTQSRTPRGSSSNNNNNQNNTQNHNTHTESDSSGPMKVAPPEDFVLGSIRLLVASGNQVFCTKRLAHSEYLSHLSKKRNKVWNLAPMLITNIPTDAQIISLCCSASEKPGANPILALALFRPRAKDYHQKAFLNIYGAKESLLPLYDDSDFTMAYSSLDICQIISLDFIPFGLRYLKMKDNHHFFLAGNDHKIHIYKGTTHFQTVERIDEFSFPTFSSSVMSFDIYKLPSDQYIWCIGCQDGHVFSSEGTGHVSFRLDTTASVIKYFPQKPVLPSIYKTHPTITSFNKKSETTTIAPLPIFSEGIDLHLLMVDATGNSLVWRNVSEKDLQTRLALPNSHLFDAVLCATVADINMDGKNELILGTYGQELLVYQDEDDHFELSFRKTLARPIVALHWGDLEGTGIPDLLVITTSFIMIMRTDSRLVTHRVTQVLDFLLEIRDLEAQLDHQTKHVGLLKEKIKGQDK